MAGARDQRHDRVCGGPRGGQRRRSTRRPLVTIGDTGASRPLFDLRITTANDDVVVIYGRLVPGVAADTLPATIWPRAVFDARARTDRLVLGLFYGALFVMALYHLVVYTSMRDASLLYFAGFVAALAGSLAVWDGLGREYLWPTSPIVNRAAATGLDGLTALFGVLFTRSFLLTQQAPRFDGALKTVGVISLTCIVLSGPATWSWSDELSGVLALGGPAVLLATGARRLTQGYRPARYYLLAVGLVVVGITVESAASYVAAAGPPGWSAYGTYAGSLVMVVLFSLGLSDRYHEVVRQHERTEAENRALQIYSYRDGLTGIANRRAFDERVVDEWRRAMREHRHIGLALLDVDDFEPHNDICGHQVNTPAVSFVAIA